MDQPQDHQALAIDLHGRHRLLVETDPTRSVVQLADIDGLVTLSIHVTEAGPVVHLASAGLVLSATGPVAIDAERVTIRGRDGLSLISGGNAEVRVAGDLTSEARVQNITAALGNVNVRANDDVRLNGERVMSNC